MIFTAVEIAEIFVGKRVRNLDGAVRSEIIENYRIAVMNFRNRFAVFFCDDGRNDEFIMNAVRIRIVHYIHCALVRRAFAVSHCAVRFFHTVPAFVAVHGVVASGNAGDFADTDFFDLLIQALNVSFRCLRTYIAAVEETVNIHLRQPFTFRKLQRRE